ncbi:MAG: potassium-transporting ATPase subunit C [Muribaculaceae bacterium]|nr:potassium-transporting ATPase subunit C [Muribaculaceae bacterium]
MKELLKSIKITLILCVFLSISYISILWLVARFATSNNGNAEIIAIDNKIVGVANIAQEFKDPRYFMSRPSCAGSGYDATSSGGSNKAPANKEYLAIVEKRILAILKTHPYLERDDIPADLVTASGSGLDPDISIEGALIQSKRIAEARNVSENSVIRIINETVEKPYLGLLGPIKVNVLKLNIALDTAQK